MHGTHPQTHSIARAYRATSSVSRLLGEQVLARAAGAPLRRGNRVRLLCDAAQNYPAWLEAIENATQSIDVETYLLHSDACGERFADAFVRAARRGVHVRLLYDWLGGWWTARHFWRRLRRDGVEVRCFNPLRPDNILTVFSRDHRKLLVVDGGVGFVGGLGVGDPWVGDRQRGREPWRDTGMEISGPAVADLARAFADNWVLSGDASQPHERHAQETGLGAAGCASVRVIATNPTEAGLYRLDTLVASAARKFLWLTDAYFVATNSYIQALAAAARDGVDVRLLLPGTSDLPLVRALSVVGYRPLLEAGVRIFEWNGTMLHAKTAVADAAWARIGSSNLNPVSWWGNWELDVAIEDEAFAGQVAEMFLGDLRHSTEITLDARRRVARSQYPERHRRQSRRRTARVVAGAMGLGSTMGAALTNHRVLTPTEARVLTAGGVVLSALGLLALKYPRSIAVPFAVLALWLALTIWIRAARLYALARRSASGHGRERTDTHGED